MSDAFTLEHHESGDYPQFVQGETQIKEDLADAMRESPAVSHDIPGTYQRLCFASFLVLVLYFKYFFKRSKKVFLECFVVRNFCRKTFLYLNFPASCVKNLH